MIVTVFGFLSSCKKDLETPNISNKILSTSIIGDWHCRYYGGQYSPISDQNDTLYYSGSEFAKMYIKYTINSNNTYIWKRIAWNKNDVIQMYDSIPGTYEILNDTINFKYHGLGYGNKYLYYLSNDSLLLQSLYDSTLMHIQVYKK